MKNYIIIIIVLFIGLSFSKYGTYDFSVVVPSNELRYLTFRSNEVTTRGHFYKKLECINNCYYENNIFLVNCVNVNLSYDNLGTWDCFTTLPSFVHLDEINVICDNFMQGDKLQVYVQTCRLEYSLIYNIPDLIDDFPSFIIYYFKFHLEYTFMMIFCICILLFLLFKAFVYYYSKDNIIKKQGYSFNKKYDDEYFGFPNEPSIIGRTNTYSVSFYKRHKLF